MTGSWTQGEEALRAKDHSGGHLGMVARPESNGHSVAAQVHSGVSPLKMNSAAGVELSAKDRRAAR